MTETRGCFICDILVVDPILNFLQAIPEKSRNVPEGESGCHGNHILRTAHESHAQKPSEYFQFIDKESESAALSNGFPDVHHNKGIQKICKCCAGLLEPGSQHIILRENFRIEADPFDRAPAF